MSVRVYLAQCKCPSGHAILAGAGEAETDAEAADLVLAPLQRQIAEMLGSAVINPWCGLCNAAAASWRYELGRTAWRTLAEAMPALSKSEAEQIATSIVFGDMKRSD